MQEANSCRVGFLPTTFVDVSESEGGSMLSRYALTFSLLVVKRREKLIQTYNQFDQKNPQLRVNP
jgi:hypothetical protein